MKAIKEFIEISSPLPMASFPLDYILQDCKAKILWVHIGEFGIFVLSKNRNLFFYGRDVKPLQEFYLESASQDTFIEVQFCKYSLMLIGKEKCTDRLLKFDLNLVITSKYSTVK